VRAPHDNVNADVANRLRPLQASRPQQIRQKPARLLDCVHAQWGESKLSFGQQSPFCSSAFVECRSLTTLSACNVVVATAFDMSSRTWKDAEHNSDSSDESESSASSPRQLPGWRLRASSPEVEPSRSAASVMPPPTDEYEPSEEKSTEAAADFSHEVRGSNRRGDGESSTRPSAEAASVARNRPMPEPVYKPQACRLCKRDTIYITRSGLSDHATVHHGCWYSAKRDEYVVILEAELEDKRRRVRDGQAHRKHRVDPADRPPARERDQEQASSYRPAQGAQGRHFKVTSGTPHCDRVTATRASPQRDQDQRQVTLSDLHRRVMVCTASLTGTTQVPPSDAKSWSGTRRRRTSASTLT